MAARIEGLVAAHAASLVELRRDLHAHPELGRAETRTTAAVVDRLAKVGLTAEVLPGGAGLRCDIGSAGPLVALRAELDALPIADEKADVAYRSTVPNVCHACGHDVHVAAVLGAGLALSALAHDQELPGRVRLLFQPAEEAIPGGALDLIAAGWLDGVESIYALHCDPRNEVGTIGLRIGPVTGSSDHLRVEVRGRGGHTARPHLTGDLVYALARIVSDVPAVLSRRVDPRAGLSLVWGQLHAGAAANVIPRVGVAEGTVRSLDSRAWEGAPAVVTEAVQSVAATYGVEAQVSYTRGVPPVVNDAEAIDVMRSAATTLLGPGGVVEVDQSLGGEDFAWYLEKIPGALARLGVRGPAEHGVRDLHQGNFDVDESSIAVGASMLAMTGVEALERLSARSGSS